MSTDADTRVTAAKTRLANANRIRITTEVRRDQANARAAEILEQLHRDFGVTTIEEARALVQSLRDEVENNLAQLEAALNTADA